jgi:hypothetical protein
MRLHCAGLPSPSTPAPAANADTLSAAAIRHLLVVDPQFSEQIPERSRGSGLALEDRLDQLGEQRHTGHIFGPQQTGAPADLNHGQSLLHQRSKGRLFLAGDVVLQQLTVAPVRVGLGSRGLFRVALT